MVSRSEVGMFSFTSNSCEKVYLNTSTYWTATLNEVDSLSNVIYVFVVVEA
jgi:hypothetical protein